MIEYQERPMEPRGVLDIDDIRHDLEGSEKFAAQPLPCASSASTPWATRGTPSLPTLGPLVSQRPVALQVRYRTLLWLEDHFADHLEFSCLIGAACQVVEKELATLLVEPARAVADHLIAALAGERDKEKQTALLTDWAAGKLPTTIGIASLILGALRFGLRQNAEPIRAFLDAHFRPPYQALAAGKNVGRCLDRLREQYRNPACHGNATFDATAYERFVLLAAANTRFWRWAVEGGLAAEPPGSTGVLHHHLEQSLQVPPAAPGPSLAQGAVDRLVGLAAPRGATWFVRVQPRQAGAGTAPRALAATPARSPRAFHVGDAMSFEVQASEGCQLVLLDISTSGEVAVVVPNRWHARARLEPQRVYAIPGPSFPEFEVTLHGRPGRERVLALAFRGEPPADLRPTGADAFRALSDDDGDGLVRAVERMPPREWTAAVCEFEVA
jgi:hypothetical protein